MDTVTSFLKWWRSTLYSLTYTSNAVKPFTKASMEELLQKARARNHLFGVTGMLLYDYGAFLQILEGRKCDVEEVYSAIERDVRHCDIKIIEKREIDSRQFNAWTMAYNDISTGVSRPKDHYRGVLTRLSSSEARTYLEFYRPRDKG
jgi:hypothetical protein